MRTWVKNQQGRLARAIRAWQHVPDQLTAIEPVRARNGLSQLVHVFLLVLVGAVVSAAVVWGLQWWGGGKIDVFSDKTTLLDLMKIGLAVTAGIGGVVALVVAYRRQKVTESAEKRFAAAEIRLDAAEARENTKQFNERFVSAANLLSSTDPPDQLAGIYALAGLADDWDAGRQTCINVLCGYLRLPYTPPTELPDDPTPDQTEQHYKNTAHRQIRHALLDLIGERLRTEPTANTWHGHHFDLSGAIIDGGGLQDIHTPEGTSLDFTSAQFPAGEVYFSYAKFTGGDVSFNRAQFTGGTVFLNSAQFTGGTVQFSSAKFSSGRVNFNAAEFTSTVNFIGAEFTGANVVFIGTRFTGGKVNFLHAEFTGSRVDFNRAKFTGSTIDFLHAVFNGGRVSFLSTKFSGGTVDFFGSRFNRGTVDFSRAEFKGSKVPFNGVEFTGGKVYFNTVQTWGVPPTFDPFPGQEPPPGLFLPERFQPTTETPEQASE